MKLGILSLLAIAAFAQNRDKRVVPVDASTRQAFDHQLKAAVLVGIGNYAPSSGLSALKYPARDVALLAAELEKQGYQVRKLVEGEASRGVIRKTLRDLAGALDPDQGTLIFYFSGHGFQQNGRNYLATYGATTDDLKDEGLAVSDVESILKQSRARQTMLWIDACRNDPAAGARSAGARSFASLQAAEGLRVLFSTRAGQVSYENDQLQQGVFTHYLVEGLRGEAAGADGLVTFRDLADYVRDQVRGFGIRTGQMQVPYEAGESSGDFLVARASVRIPEVVPERPRGPEPGQLKANPKDGQRYVWIPPGTFTMGCSPGDLECGTDEKPAHRVSITKGFWLGQTAVTVGAYKRFASATGASMPPEPKLLERELNPGWKDDQQPIVDVTWEEARSYCGWAGERLPTEAEWEYAARAGSEKARYDDLDSVAWFADNSGNSRIDSVEIWKSDQKNYSKRVQENGNGPKAVGQKRPNAWRLFDMLGNVWQWTADWYGAEYYKTSESQDPPGAPGGQSRTLRGGSWLNLPRNVRVSFRNWFVPDSRNFVIGLRCVGE